MYTNMPDPQSSFTCTVIVCTRNRPLLLRRCLEQLEKQASQSFEVLVVDNCLAPSDACSIAASFGARYILCPLIGLSHARNAGIAASYTDFLAFLDDDAIPERNWLCELLAEFSCQEVAAVTGQIVLEGDGDEVALYSQSRLCIDQSTPSWFEIANFGGIGCGSNMAFRRSALQSWPGFDERLGRGRLLNAGEDDCAFFTLVDRGHSIVYAPSARVRHPQRTSGRHLFKSLHRIAIVSACITLLAVEHSIYVPRIHRFVLDSVRRRPRSWRRRSPEVFDGCAPIWLICLAFLAGPFLYFSVRLANMVPKARPKEAPLRKANIGMPLEIAKSDD
jgi:glycosyltransferase involved in cell wall biosynthesis